jgi:hypothetical protein
MGQPEKRFLESLYRRFPGRVAIGVAYSQEMNEIFPIVIDDDQGNVLGIVAMAVMTHEQFVSVHIYHFSVFSPRNGKGTKMLNILCRKADRLNVVLSLSPIPSPNGEDHHMGSQKLATWYRQFGFEGETLLRRQPRPTHR